MEELATCSGQCCRKHEKVAMHRDQITKMGDTRVRYYCAACWERKNRYFALKAAKRNFRSAAPKRSNTNAKYSIF